MDDPLLKYSRLKSGHPQQVGCDLRIAAASAVVKTGYLRVGLSGDYGIAWLLSQLDGRGCSDEAVPLLR